MTKQRPERIGNLLERIRECLQKDKYTFTTHALLRQKERKFTVAEIRHVLKTGYEEKQKTCFDIEKNKWKYAIRGKTMIDELDVRVIITFEENGMLIITVMYVGGL